PLDIEQAIWRDFFYKLDWDQPISVNLEGSGPDTRSMQISRGSSQLIIPLAGAKEPTPSPSLQAPLVFTWKDSAGQIYTYGPKISAGGLQLETSKEQLPDYFLIAANQTMPPAENANRFSVLSRSKRAQQFTQLFTREYKWIEDIGIEVIAGSPVLHV